MRVEVSSFEGLRCWGFEVLCFAQSFEALRIWHCNSIFELGFEVWSIYDWSFDRSSNKLHWELMGVWFSGLKFEVLHEVWSRCRALRVWDVDSWGVFRLFSGFQVWDFELGFLSIDIWGFEVWSFVKVSSRFALRVDDFRVFEAWGVCMRARLRVWRFDWGLACMSEGLRVWEFRSDVWGLHIEVWGLADLRVWGLRVGGLRF